ncbi:hypothetical protein L9F63_005892, partial [Diploptera punctata]
IPSYAFRSPNDSEIRPSLGVEHKSEDWRLFIDSSKTTHAELMKDTQFQNKELVNEMIENYKLMGWAVSDEHGSASTRISRKWKGAISVMVSQI